MIKRRLGRDPHSGGIRTGGIKHCPDIFEMDNGDIAVIGIRKTDLMRMQLPSSAGCGPDEEIVIVPRSVLLAAKEDISKLE